MIKVYSNNSKVIVRNAHEGHYDYSTTQGFTMLEHLVT